MKIKHLVSGKGFRRESLWCSSRFRNQVARTLPHIFSAGILNIMKPYRVAPSFPLSIEPTSIL